MFQGLFGKAQSFLDPKAREEAEKRGGVAGGIGYNIAKQLAPKAAAAAGTAGAGVLQRTGTTLAALGAPIGRVAEAVGAPVVKAAEAVGAPVLSAAKAVAAPVANAAKAVAAPVANAAETVGQAVSPVAQQAASAVGSAAMATASAASSIATKAANSVVDAARSLAETKMGVQLPWLDGFKGWVAGLGLWFAGLSWFSMILIAIVIIGITLIILWATGVFSATPSEPKQLIKAETTAAVLNAQVSNAPQAAAAAEGFQDGSIALGDAPRAAPAASAPLSLLNLQPLSIKQAGFLGPAAAAGKFDPPTAVSQALRAGFRAFTLQIDYLSAKKGSTDFPAAGMPTLLYKDVAGNLTSANAGSIRAVAETIAAQAFSPESPNYSTPVVLYLHIVRAPSPVRESEQYIRYLSQIARELAPLAPKHLGVTPLGIFHRQKNEETLFSSPLSALEGQVVILSNADTDLFRQQSAGTAGQPAIPPAEDLDYWVNARVYLEDDSVVIGATHTAPADKKARAFVFRFQDIMAVPAVKSDAFAVRGKGRFVIGLSEPTKNPSAPELGRALNELGVNMIPLDIFSASTAEVTGLVEEYSNMSYRPKPPALQNIQS